MTKMQILLSDSHIGDDESKKLPSTCICLAIGNCMKLPTFKLSSRLAPVFAGSWNKEIKKGVFIQNGRWRQCSSC